LILKCSFGPEKLPGLSRNGPLEKEMEQKLAVLKTIKGAHVVF